MRAHSQRRLIWILNVVLGLGLIALVAWIFLDVRPATADATYLKPMWAVQAVEDFRNTPPTNRSALKPPVSQQEVEEIDRREFRAADGARFHWVYSGPMPPAPPEPAAVVETQAPVEDDLSKLGHVALLIFIGPRGEQTTAEETVVFWQFSDADVRKAFSPGEFIRPRSDTGTGGIKLVDVKPIAGERRYDLHYEVYRKDDGPAEKSGVFVYDGNKPLSPELQARIKERRKVPGVAAKDTTPEDASSGGTSGGLTQPVEAPVPTEVLDPTRINPTVKYENQNSARVTFDQGTYDYFRKTNPDVIAKTVKTQVARDSQGKVIGLQITGISKEAPADRFDVKPGDILVSIDGKPVKSRSDAMNIAQGLDPNTKLVRVVVDRRGRLVTFDIDPTNPETRRAARTLDNR